MHQQQQQHQKAADVVVYVGTNKAGRHSPSSTMIIMLWLVLLIYCDIKTFCFLYCCSAAIIEVTPEHLPKGVHTYVYLLLLSTFHTDITDTYFSFLFAAVVAGHSVCIKNSSHNSWDTPTWQWSTSGDDASIRLLCSVPFLFLQVQ